MFILDTNVVSELRRRKPHGAVLAWLSTVPSEALYISAMTAGEIQAGIEMTRATDTSKAIEIETWLDNLLTSMTVLDATAPVFREWARLMAKRSDDDIEDCLIAATAMVHDKVVVTRNVRDFAPFPVKILNPFEHGTSAEK